MKRRSILSDNPPTAIANDGKTVLRRYRVDGVIYARNVKEARARLGRVLGSQVGAENIDDALIVPPGTGSPRRASEDGTS